MQLDKSSITNINEYLNLLHVELPKIENSAEQLDDFWCRNYNSDIGKMTLAMGLFLIHPVFHKRLDGTPIALKFRHSSTFSERHKDAIMTGYCKINFLVNDAVCLGTDTVSDHNWPWSLGGPTRGENHLELCGACNRSKSNSILLFDWEQKIEHLEWVIELLQAISTARGGR